MEDWILKYVALGRFLSILTIVFDKNYSMSRWIEVASRLALVKGKNGFREVGNVGKRIEELFTMVFRIL